MRPVLMLGEGAWGTAIATVLADNGLSVNLWCNDPCVASDIADLRENRRYLPHFVLNSLINPVTNLETAGNQAEYVFISTPVQYFRSVATRCKKWYSPNQIWIVLSKGIENSSLLLPTQIVQDIFGQNVQVAALTGPSFAHEVVKKEITGLNLGAYDTTCMEKIKRLVGNNYIQIFPSNDVIGMQMCAALKNVIALGMGILEGAGCGENTRAFFLTRILHEIAHIVDCCGGKKETLYDLSGIGDIVLTSMSNKSRNYSVGRALGSGRLLSEFLEKTGYTPEGINTIYSAIQIAHSMDIQIPLCTVIFQFIQRKATLKQVQLALINRN